MTRKQSVRPCYTSDQVKEYLNYIGLSEAQRISFPPADPGQRLEFLHSLIRYQLARVPFENLDLHYSPHRSISLDSDHLFHKIVERQNGRGGYCMENNLFFGTILRSIGFDVMPVGARVCSSADSVDGSDLDVASYSGFTHAVNIVTVADKKYLCDVGFGARGPTSPIPLKDGFQGVTMQDESGGTFFRLAREHILDNTHATPEQLLWVYSVRFSVDRPWMPVYCFTEVEFLPQDFTVMSFYVSKSPTSFFTRQVICQKFILDEHSQVVGCTVLFERDIKERRGGKSRQLTEINSEADRVDALRRFLDLKLSKPEINGIQGMPSRIA